MIRNFFKTALRNIRRNKLFSIINVLGLSVGISAALVIYLIVQYDFSFDKFHKDGDRIYRVVTEMKFSGATFPNSGVPQPITEALRKYASGIEESTALFTQDFDVRIAAAADVKAAKFHNQSHIIITDNNYFKLLPVYKWLAGSPSTAMQQPFRIVLTDSRAKAYFPGLTPDQILGRQIFYNDSVVCNVEGIVKDLDQNTDFTFLEFMSMPTLERAMKDQINTEWGSVSSSYQLFVKLAPQTSPTRIEKQLADLRAKFSQDKKGDSTNQTKHYLQALSDLHFNSAYDNFGQRLANKPTLYGLLLVSVFLLALACINFINLTTAQGGQRAREIGIRKTMGGTRRQLVFQFLSEAFMLTLLGAVLSVLLTPWLLKVFSDFIPEGLHFNILHQPSLILFLLALLVVVSILAGFYPALVLSRFNPILALKSQSALAGGFGGSTTRRTLLRKTLTVAQFVIAQVFIMATLIVGKQIHYSLDKDMGFKKDAIVYFRTPYNAANRKARIAEMENKLHAIPGISLISQGTDAPASSNTWSSTMTYKDGKKSIETDVQIKQGDSNYVRVYGIRFLAGRNLLVGDSVKEIVINETYMHILGFKDPREALGKMIEEKTIVGVIGDFHQASLHKTIKPLALTPYTNFFNNTFHILLRQPSNVGANTGSMTTATDNRNPSWTSTIAAIEKAYKEVFPDDQFDYKFFDESIARFYTSEQHISSLLRWATGLTIFISCLGLLGLVVYSTRLRTKEIGVRKVLGASVGHLVSILSKDFIRLVFIAFVIAVPLAWWATHQWLQNFAYRTTVSWWLFAISGSAMLVIALLTLGFQTIRAASANPVDSLRSE